MPVILSPVNNKCRGREQCMLILELLLYNCALPCAFEEKACVLNKPKCALAVIRQLVKLNPFCESGSSKSDDCSYKYTFTELEIVR